MDEPTRTDLLDYAEQAGIANMQEWVDVANMIQREANTALTVLLAGGAGSIAYAAEHAGSAMGWAAAASAVYFFGLAALLNVKCLGLIRFPATHNEPMNLYQPQYTLTEIRAVEIENLQQRILDAQAHVDQRSVWLNRCRVLAAGVPAAALLGWGLAAGGLRAWAGLS